MYTCALNLENGNGYLALVELPYRHYFKLNFGGWRHIGDSQNIVDQLYKYLELKVVEIGITNIPNYLLYNISVGSFARGFSMETFRTHEYGMPLVWKDHMFSDF